MKRLSFIVLLFLSLITYHLSLQTSFSQEKVFDFDRAYQDYLYTYGTYRKAHNEYVSAKEQYLTYKTLTSKTLAFEQTLDMLQKRDETIRTYLTALRMKMAETTGISSYKQNTIYLKLDADVSWYTEHREEISSAATLDDLVKSAKETEKRYQKTLILVYQALGTILEGKENNLRNQLDEQVEAVKEKLSQIRQKGDKDTTIAERWFLEAENKLTRSQEKLDEAGRLLEAIKEFDRDKGTKYNQAQKLYQESHLYLREANSNLKELIREIKTSDVLEPSD